MLKTQLFPFSQYVLRTPVFSVTSYFKLLDNYSIEALWDYYEMPFVQEAIKLASPELFLELKKYKENQSGNSNDKKKALEISLLKYVTRMATRCTPFGLFAGCSIGYYSNQTTIIVSEKEKHNRFTQFDMHFWVAMLQAFAKQKKVINELIYYPNNSIYSLGDFYRYIEYKYVKTKREHSITALRKSILLEKLLHKAKMDITVNEMVSLLIDDASEKIEALAFINQLIDFQFLVSELDATVTGNDEWERVFSILSTKPSLTNQLQQLKIIKKEFVNLDRSIVPLEQTYVKIKETILKMGLEFEDKFLFQTDLNTTTSSNTLDLNNLKKVKKALIFLNGIQEKTEFTNQSNFIKSFVKRYETREMPLTTVLDTETGIGYLQDNNINDSHDILEKFSFKTKRAKGQSKIWTNYDLVLQKKWQECSSNNQKEMTISEKDFTNFDSNLKYAPATFSVLIEVIKNQGNECIVIQSSGNTSAAKLIGRFCNGNSAIYNLTKQIVEKEKAYHTDKILAEIVHIPESRTGNILRRPVLREYEISYLSNIGYPQVESIQITDLMISIQDGNIILRSKKLNKQVLPCLSNAHNFSSNSLPIYHFLCDLQSQNTKPIYSFSWGALESQYTFFPRVKFQDCILSKAKWIITKEEISLFYTVKSNQLKERFSVWINSRSIPRYVTWVNYDNTLLLDFEKEISIAMFLKSVSRFDTITLEEFLFTEELVVKNIKGERFTNEFIVSFYKE